MSPSKRLVLTVLLSLFAWVQQSQAAVTATAIVKVESGLCSSSSLDFHGSGTIFKQGQDYYVLTSEHVLLHGNSPYCHQVSNEKFGKLSAQLMIADWGTGLALLKINQTASLQGSAIPSLNDFSADVQSNDPVIVGGYPYSSNEIIWDQGGKVLTAESSRNVIPLLTKVIELENAHGEYGMSGGAVISAENSEFVGVLSYQFIKMVLGAPSVVADYSSGSEQTIQNDLIVIPASFASRWLQSYFNTQGSMLPSFVRDPELQLLNQNGQEAVFSSGLRFEIAPSTTNGSGVGGGDGAGVGGGDGAGVGGGDGAGVGGPSNPSGNAVGAVVSITLDPGKHPTRWALDNRADFLSQLTDLLGRRNQVTVPFMLQSMGDSRGLRTLSFSSLEEFVQDLLRADLSPKVVSKSLLPSVISSPGDAALQGVGAQLQALTGAMDAQVSSKGSIATQQLLKSLADAGQILGAGGDAGIQVSVLNGYAGDEAAWTELFSIDFEHTVALRKALLQAISLSGS